uniref:NAD(P)(+)--arginine ADP-ribosyltransferase n=1 Tax=Ficedula albicollis TaxID=59894 RepID=A0A803V0T1_FICAL
MLDLGCLGPPWHPCPLSPPISLTSFTSKPTVKPLDMALDSFDDQYQNCSHAMKAALPALNRFEFQNNSLFTEVWSQAVSMWRFRGSPVSPLSSSDQATALMVYTMIFLSEQFNNEVSVAGRSPQEYRDNFHFKTLHFLLTDALEEECHCVFWGVDKYKFEANVGDIVRFGQFASSTLCEDTIHDLRTTTVFKVITCHGVDIREFSRYPSVEEVLIPPFEMFNVTKVMEKGTSVEIHLDSIGTYSKYNCEWLTGGDSLGPWGHPLGPWGHPLGPWGHPLGPWGHPLGPWGHPLGPWGHALGPWGHT